MFTGTTTINAANGEEQKTSGSKFKRELSKMSEKQASQIQIAIWVIGGLCILIMAITGASVGYVINSHNERLDALETWRQEHMEKSNTESKLLGIEKDVVRFDDWIKEHTKIHQEQISRMNENIFRIATKLNVDLK